MYTLQNLYDYLTAGTALTVAGSFQEPSAGPGSSMVNTRKIGDDVKALFDQGVATTADVKSGVKFFSTVPGSWGVQTGIMAGPGYCTVLKTGQTTVYQTGDDGTYSSTKGKAFSYSWDVNPDTVKDNITGLIWASSGTGAGCKSGGSVGSWSSAIIWAEGLSFAGYTDWRLPNATELATLFVRTAALDPGPFINKTWFPGTLSEDYWSSTTLPSDSSRAIYGRFSNGNLGASIKTAPATATYVRAVRGGE